MAYVSTSLFIIEGSQELETGNGTDDMEECCLVACPISVCVCLHTHTYICICMYVYIHVHIYAHIYQDHVYRNWALPHQSLIKKMHY